MIRPAVVADAAAIARIQVQGWETAYRGIMPDHVLEGLDVEQARRRWHDGLANGAEVGVDERAGAIRGFVATGPCRDEDRIGWGEVYALYVELGWWGRGIGRVLLESALDALWWHDYEGGVLWVLRDNTRARRFYEKQGWVFDGTEQVSQWGPVECRHVYQANA